MRNVKNINILISQNKINPDNAVKLIECFKDINKVLKVFDFKKKDQYSAKVQDLITKRGNARKEKNFKLADKIREQLSFMGINVHDKKVN